MANTPAFAAEYKKLNPEQKEAVDAIEGPVMVIAGPGTGKTQILTLRIANILKRTDTPPDAILALTFTEAGVSAMRKRLVSLIGPAGYRVGIYTFHGFCNATIQRLPDDFPRLVSSEAITDIDKILLVRDLVERDEELDHLRPFYDNFARVRDIIGAISTLKREYVNPDDLAERVAAEEQAFWERDDLYNAKGPYAGKMKTAHQATLKRLARNKELVRIYRAYEDALRETKRYDYEDMIGMVVARLEEERDVLQRLQEEYHYILADEHQDANTAQNRLLELLVDFHDNPNLFIVGDEKQAIFRFQGASLENFLYFKKKYPDAQLVELTRAYRSGQRILDAAHSVIESGPEDIERTALTSHAAVAHADVEVRAFARDELELHWVATDIKARIDAGVEPHEIAVLYRTNSDAAPLARALERVGVPHTIESTRTVLDDPAIAQFVMLIRAVAEYGNDEPLGKVLHARFLDFDPLDVYKVLRLHSKTRMPLAECLRDEDRLAEYGVGEAKRMAVFGKRLAKWATSGANDPVPDVFNQLLDESGFLAFALNSTRSLEMLEKLAGLARDTEQLSAGERAYTVRDLLHHFDLMDTYRLSITPVRASDRPHAGVRLMTAHRSKGQEFDYVYLIGAWDTHWGNTRSNDLFALPIPGASEEEANADERRLFYVALTRARAGVFISYARTSPSGRERLPSQFIEEIREPYKEEKDTRAFEESVQPQVLVGVPSGEEPVGVADAEYLRALFLEQGLSVTALNNYLTCPWQYFYSNLVRIPKIPTKHMLFGTVVHRALKRFFDARQKSGADKETLLNIFEDELARTTLSGSAYTEIEKRGRDYLSGWFDARVNGWQQETLNEYRVDTLIPTNVSSVPQLRVRGELDKVELHPDGVVVVDYKTGTPKSRNDILGTTKARGAGDYFRQLVFYKMLLDTEGVYTMRTGVVDFIQPKESGTYVQETFAVTAEDVEQLQTEIERVAGEIYDLSFWDSRCAEHTKKGACEYCALRELMRGE